MLLAEQKRRKEEEKGKSHSHLFGFMLSVLGVINVIKVKVQLDGVSGQHCYSFHFIPTERAHCINLGIDHIFHYFYSCKARKSPEWRTQRIPWS